ncbi:MAG: RHS repeat-associated core domain-containing protein, partial [Anaerolineae bacterium]
YDARGRCTGVEQGGLRWFYTYDGAVTSYGQPSAMVWNWNGQGDPARSSGARILRYTYDDRGQLVGSEDPAGGERRYGYDEAGRLVSVTDRLGRTRTIAYDPAGRVVRQADALGGQTVYTYDAAGHLTTVTDAAGSVTAYAYDHAGRLTGVTDPLGRRTGRVYDNEGYLLSRTDARGDTVTFSNDALGRPLALSYSGGQAWHLTYDAAGNVTSMSGQGLARTVQRDVAGHVLQVADIRAGRTIWVAYAYNASGQVAEMRTSDGSLTTYTHGRMGELVRISGPRGDTEYTYQTLGQLAPQRVGVRTGPLRTTLSYDALGQLTSIRQYQQVSRQGVDRTTRYTYDAVGNVIAMETPEGTTAYSYDDLDRLTGWVDRAGIETTYAYDAVGNRTSLAVEGGATIDYRYDAAHQLLQAGDTAYTYDRNGRLVSAAGAGGLRTYSWDYDGRLVSVAERGPCALPYPLGPVATNDEAVVGYGYAPTGERVQTVRADGVLETYRYDGSQAVAVLDEAGRVLEARQRGAESDDWTIAALSPGEAGGSPLVRYLLSDAYGSVVGAADEAGALVWQVAYDPWGVPKAAGNEGSIETLTRTGFQGHAYDAETGLYDLDGRWYDPAVGRYLSPDPAGSACGPDTVNGYLFAQNNPLRFTRILSESHRPIIAACGLCARGGAQEGSLCPMCGATAGSTGVGAYGAIGQLFAQLPGVESGLACP